MSRENRHCQSALWVCAVAAVVAGAVPTLAAEGRIPLWTQTSLAAPGGKYVVTRNIFATPGSGLPAIDISAPGAYDIDLNGFTVTGDPLGGAPAISAVAPGLESVTIRNGSVRNPGLGDCISVILASRVVVEDVKMSCSGQGLFVDEGQTFAVRRNVVTLSSLNAIWVSGSPAFAGTLPISGVIEDNQIYDPGATGIQVDETFSSVTIRGNEVESPGAAGIAVIGAPGPPVGSVIVAENTVQEAGTEGILIRQVNKGKV